MITEFKEDRCFESIDFGDEIIKMISAPKYVEKFSASSDTSNTTSYLVILVFLVGAFFSIP
ncbi:hypothetical protein [Gelidibacter mesophilus]|uniref:hypothetical protein n=1 Tax=Gelidibacter mesophilus TaxID=169050 RepID=UPI0003F7D035|nr:hypothetical protein [Gelidibacter mesophilus]